MNYLPRKIIQEEINKINPKISFGVRLTTNRGQFLEDELYIIKLTYKKFEDTYCKVIPIPQDILKEMDTRSLREHLHHESLRFNREISSYKGRKEIKRRTIESTREWAMETED
jgi:hypothetical protein